MRSGGQPCAEFREVRLGPSEVGLDFGEPDPQRHPRELLRRCEHGLSVDPAQSAQPLAQLVAEALEEHYQRDGIAVVAEEQLQQQHAEIVERVGSGVLSQRRSAARPRGVRRHRCLSGLPTWATHAGAPARAVLSEAGPRRHGS